MPYYLVKYEATLNGINADFGMIRCSGAYNPNMVKKSVERYYRRSSINKTVAVVIIDKAEVTYEEYESKKNKGINTN